MLDGNKGALAMVVLMKIIIYGGTAMANGKKIANIYWNTTNPIFHFDNEEHIFVVRILDSVDFVCPKYAPGYPEERMEYSYIYLVDRASYEKCVVDTTRAQILGFCTSPYKGDVITVVFRTFTPSPNLLQFQPDQFYYVISTSDGSPTGLKNEQHGLCYNYNMRLQFYVKPQCRPRQLERTSRRQALMGDRSKNADNDDSSQDYEDCDEKETGVSMKENPAYPPPVVVLPRVPSLTQDVRPPSPRRPYQWPNDHAVESFPNDVRRPAGPWRNSTHRTMAAYSNLSLCWLAILLLTARRQMVDDFVG